jgi:hypothetical protein
MPDRMVKVHFTMTESIELPRYPILGKPYVETLIVHPSKIPGLDGDYDGDMCNSVATWGKEANEQTEKYLNDPVSIFDDTFRIKSGAKDMAIMNVLASLSAEA